MSFDTDLGYLQAGDTIYVAYGGYETQKFDFFLTDFSFSRIVPRIEPLRQIENTVDFFVGDANAVDNFDRIAEVLFEAAQYGATSGQPVEIHLQANQVYHIQNPAHDETTLFHLIGNRLGFRPENIVFNGHGSTILIDDPTVGFLEIGSGKNIIFRDLAIDYSTLPFTQGTIVSLDQTAATIDLKIDQADSGNRFPLPTDVQFDGHQRDDFFLWGYSIKPDSPGELKDGTNWHYPTRYDRIAAMGGGIYRIQLNQLDGLGAGD